MELDINAISHFWNMEVKEKKQLSERAFLLETTTKEKYVLKKKGEVSRIKSEFELLHFLKTGAHTPISNSAGEYIIRFDNNHFCLYHFLEGESLSAKVIIHNPRVAQRLGEALGGMHLRMKQFTRTDKFPEKDLYHSVYGWAMQELSFDPELTKIYELLHDEFGQVIRGLPKQVIHRDVHLFNIIFKDETILGMIDFDLVEVNTRVFDLCYCATSVLNEIFGDSQLREEWIDFVSSLVSGYQLADSLTDEENQSIWYVMLAIQSIFMAYFVHQADLFRTNKEMFLWIFENRKKVESTL